MQTKYQCFDYVRKEGKQAMEKFLKVYLGLPKKLKQALTLITMQFYIICHSLLQSFFSKLTYTF